jgi:hypothetical protein
MDECQLTNITKKKEKKKKKTGKSNGVTISPVPGINRPPFLAR